MTKLWANLGLKAKAIGGTVVAALLAVQAALLDQDTPGRIAGWEWPTIPAAALVVLVGVWNTPVTALQAKAKLYAGAALAGLTTLVAALRDGEGLTQGEVISIVVAVLVAGGLVYALPEARKSEALAPPA